jgi:diacylglycerol kinase (ATP)
VRVEISDGPDAPVRITRDALGRGDGIVACGGDGLVADVAGSVAEHEGLLAIVPTGAGNDFARGLGYRVRDPLAAVALLATGRERRVDLGRAGGKWFTSVANTGFDAEANRWANGVQRLHGTGLYLAAIARTVVTYRPHRFRLAIDSAAPIDFVAWLVAFGNTPTYAGGMKIAPAAVLDDGILEVTVVGDLSRADFIMSFPRVFGGSHVRHRKITTYRGRRFDIASRDPTVPMELYASGERVGPLPQRVEVVPAALRVLAP